MPRARESGSWVSEPIDVFDGEKRTYIYKRPKTKKWQLYIKTENEGVIRESTKQEDQEEALTYARERWYEIQGRQRSGLKVKREKKLFDFAEEFLEEERKRISSVPRKGITKETFRIKRVHLRWLQEFFDGRNPKLESLDRRSLYNYGTWRQKDSSTPPKTNHTINAEISTIRSLFTYLYTNEWIDQVPPIKSMKTEAPEDLRRDYLTLAEWKSMLPTLNAYRKDKTTTSRMIYNRNVVYCGIVIMINSAIRIGELKQLKWSDIEHNPHLKGEDRQIHHLINIRGETTKTGKPRRVNSPTQVWFDRLRVLSGIPKAGKNFPHIPNAYKDQYVFCKEQKGDQPFGLGTWNRCWREIKDRVIEAGGDWMNKKNISYYSFRHSGISFAVQRGVNHLILVRNAGTGLRYIEAFYYHHEAELSTIDLSNGRTFFAKNTEVYEPLLD